ncbi:MAG TPA: GNAT family N-acetyltransferase [Thermoanaerobaculia bacterium]|jgi:GNAT superfamily N-acetyltransferase
MSPNVTIRLAAASDRDDLARLSTQLGYPLTPGEASARLSELSGHPDHALLVAESDGRLAGWLQVSLPRIFESSRQAEIAGLVVDEDARGRGIGPALLRAAERWARERGCVVLRVRSNVIRERAHGFYRREGFGEIKTQRVFEKPLGD